MPIEVLSAALLAISAGFCAVAAVCVAPGQAQATTYQIQSRTAARATQHLRSDTTFAAPRVFSQSLTLSAYDLRNNDRGDVDARVSLRYVTDLGLAERLRQDPLFDARFNDLSLDLAYVIWRPAEGLELQAGRQWHHSSLGITDFDGLALRWRSQSQGWQPFAAIAVGRDVQRGLTPWDPGAWDVQGLPPNESALTDNPWHLLAAANAGAGRDRRHRFEVSAQQHRRPRADQVGQWITTHRVGATATTTPADPVTLTTTASYHSVVGHLDRTRIDAAFRITGGVLSTGVDHRRPVFDSSSIFNLFGAQPHRSAYATYRRPVAPLAGALELRSWTRFYFDETRPLWSLGDERAVGAALGGRHRFEVVVPLRLFWQMSAQTMTGQSGGDQYLGDLRLRATAPVEGLFVTGRLLGLYASPSHHRRSSGYATTAALGTEITLGDLAKFSLNIESRLGSFTPPNTALFALFELEASR